MDSMAAAAAPNAVFGTGVLSVAGVNVCIVKSYDYSSIIKYFEQVIGRNGGRVEARIPTEEDVSLKLEYSDILANVELFVWNSASSKTTDGALAEYDNVVFTGKNGITLTYAKANIIPSSIKGSNEDFVNGSLEIKPVGQTLPSISASGYAGGAIPGGPGSPITAAMLGLLIAGADEKTTPVDADEVGLVDSMAASVIKRLTWANLRATLKAYFDTLYIATAALASKMTNPMAAVGDGITGGAAGAPVRFAGNTATRKKFRYQTGDGAGNVTTDAWGTIGVGDLRDLLLTATLSGSTYSVSPGTAPSSYFDGMALLVRFPTANAGACALNVSSLGDKSIKTVAGADPGAGALPANGLAWLVYDAGTNRGWFQIV